MMDAGSVMGFMSTALRMQADEASTRKYEAQTKMMQAEMQMKQADATMAMVSPKPCMSCWPSCFSLTRTDVVALLCRS